MLSGLNRQVAVKPMEKKLVLAAYRNSYFVPHTLIKFIYSTNELTVVVSSAHSDDTQHIVLGQAVPSLKLTHTILKSNFSQLLIIWPAQRFGW